MSNSVAKFKQIHQHYPPADSEFHKCYDFLISSLPAILRLVQEATCQALGGDLWLLWVRHWDSTYVVNDSARGR